MNVTAKLRHYIFEFTVALLNLIPVVDYQLEEVLIEMSVFAEWLQPERCFRRVCRLLASSGRCRCSLLNNENVGKALVIPN